MAKKRKINTKNIGVIIFLFALMILSWKNWEQTKYVIRIILEWEPLYFFSFGLTIIIFGVAFFNKAVEIDEHKLISNRFGNFFDTVISCLTYAAGITSSLTLIKGFYIQQLFTDKVYFTEFSNIDQWLIFLTMCFLLYFCTSRVVEMLKELILIKDTADIE